MTNISLQNETILTFVLNSPFRHWIHNIRTLKKEQKEKMEEDQRKIKTSRRTQRKIKKKQQKAREDNKKIKEKVIVWCHPYTSTIHKLPIHKIDLWGWKGHTDHYAYSPVSVKTDSSLEKVLIKPARLQSSLLRQAKSWMKYTPRYRASTPAIISRYDPMNMSPIARFVIRNECTYKETNSQISTFAITWKNR